MPPRSRSRALIVGSIGSFRLTPTGFVAGAKLRMLLVGVVLLAVALPSTSATAQEEGQFLDGPPGPGVAIAIYSGGPIEDLPLAAPNAQSFFVTVEGKFIGYVVGAPDFVNGDFVQLFHGGIPASTPMIVLSSENAANPSDDGGSPPVSFAGGGPSNTNINPGPGPSRPPSVLWQVGADERQLLLGPVVSGLDLYFSDGDAIHSYSAADGTHQWTRDRTEFTATDDALFFIPVPCGELICVSLADRSNEPGVILAFDADDGTERWRWRYQSGFEENPDPTSDEGLVYVREAGTIYVLRAEDGQAVRSFASPWDGQSPEYLSVAGDEVYLTLGGQVVAADKTTGEPRWRSEVPPYDESTGFEWRNAYSPPAVVGDLVIIATYGDQDRLVALDRLDGTERWVIDLAPRDLASLATPSSDGERVYVALQSGTTSLYAFDAGSGAELWEFRPAGGRVLTTATIVADDLYVGGYEEFEAADTPFIYRLDVETGALEWKVRVDGFPYLAPVVTQGILFVSTYGIPNNSWTSGNSFMLALGERFIR
jgi:outer membrane protein assembly factor BamB